jgi:WD40 repeat protein
MYVRTFHACTPVRKPHKLPLSHTARTGADLMPPPSQQSTTQSDSSKPTARFPMQDLIGCSYICVMKGICLLDLTGHRAGVYAVTCDLIDDVVLSGAADNTLKLWDCRQSACVCTYPCPGTRFYVTHNNRLNADAGPPPWALAFSPFGYYFACAHGDGTARLYCTDRLQVKVSVCLTLVFTSHQLMLFTFRGYAQPVRLFCDHISDVMCVKFHPNGSYLCTGGEDKTIRLYHLSKGSCIRSMTGVQHLLCTRRRLSVLICRQPFRHHLLGRVSQWQICSSWHN